MLIRRPERKEYVVHHKVGIEAEIASNGDGSVHVKVAANVHHARFGKRHRGSVSRAHKHIHKKSADSRERTVKISFRVLILEHPIALYLVRKYGDKKVEL